LVQCDRLKALCEQWRPSQIIAEQNSIGQPVIEQLTRDGLQITPFNTTNSSKAKAIEALALAFERVDVQILDDPTLVSELVAYQAERLPSGLLRYGAPAGGHDDMVMALALAWTAVSGQHHLIYPIPEGDIVVPEFLIPAHWPRAYGLDIRGRKGAAIWGALDPKSDVLYLFSDYLGDADPANHVAAIRGRGGSTPGLIDPSGNGRERTDGLRLVQMYRDHGLTLHHVNNSIESGIMEVSQRMLSGRLKVFPSLVKYLAERRLYRRDEGGQVVKAHDNLQDATRCLVIGLSLISTEPAQDDDEEERWGDFSYYGRGGQGSWMR
jgi:hypothetical protein